MASRTKHEAKLRLSMGVARTAMRDGKSPIEALQEMRDHFALMRRLDNSDHDFGAENDRSSEQLCGEVTITTRS